MLKPVSIGAGDAYHYALQAADFDAQVKAGVFPVLVGQSIFGLNGNIHTLRTAPYYVHLCGAIYCITDGLVSPYGIQDLAAIVSALAGAAMAWLAIRTLAPSERVLSALLAVLYISASGVTGRLLVSDMYASYMASPWIPLVLLGAVQCVEHRDIRGPAFLTAWALAMTWYAHPPTGILLLPVLFLAGLIRLVRGPDRVADLGTALTAAAGFAVMAWYLLYSVKSLKLDYNWQGWSADEMTYDLSRLIPELNGFFRSLPNAYDPPIGYAFLALTLLGFVTLRRGGAGPWLLAAIVVAYALAFVTSPISAYLWHGPFFPVIPVISPRPMDRCRPILTALAVIWSAYSIARIVGRRAGLRAACALILLTGIYWNLVQLRRLMPLPPWRDSAPSTLSAENAVLTRSSYLLFGEFSGYFSNSRLDPMEETRLLDRNLVEVDETNAGHLLARPGREPVWHAIDGAIDLPLENGKGCALEFRFASGGGIGEIRISSGPMRRIYTLPSSGGRFAFGSSAIASHVLLVDARDNDGKVVHLESSVPGTSVRLRFYDDDELPLRVTRLIPLEVQVRANVGGFLESPRSFIPGYRATVDGRPAVVKRSPEGMVMVPVGAGQSVVRIDYPGPPMLSTAYFVSLIGMISWPWLTSSRYRRPARHDPTGHSPGRWRRVALGGVALVAVIGIARLSGRLITVGSTPEISVVDGTASLGVTFPRWPRNTNEPLLVLGRSGSADVVFVRYVDPEHIRIGVDAWGVGGPLSEAIPYAPGRLYRMDFSLPRLRENGNAGNPSPQSERTRITIDGREVISGNLEWHHLPPDPLGVGANLIGATSCASRFSGGMFLGDGTVISP
jgi:hypothetical protein